MAVTFVATPNNSNRGSQTGKLVMSGTYTNPGGDAITPKTFGLTQLFSLDVNPSAGFAFEYIPTSADPTAGGKLKAYWTGAGLSAALAEVTNATSMAGVTNAHYEAIGI